MQHCVLVVSGFVVTVMGPFKTKELAKKWADAEGIKAGYVVVPILSPGEIEGELD